MPDFLSQAVSDFRGLGDSVVRVPSAFFGSDCIFRHFLSKGAVCAIKGSVTRF